jgi:hypothetical protein
MHYLAALLAHDLTILFLNISVFFCSTLQKGVRSVTRVYGGSILFRKTTRMLTIASYDQKFGHWVSETRGDAASILRGLPTSTAEMLGRYTIQSKTNMH